MSGFQQLCFACPPVYFFLGKSELTICRPYDALYSFKDQTIIYIFFVIVLEILCSNPFSSAHHPCASSLSQRSLKKVFKCWMVIKFIFLFFFIHCCCIWILSLFVLLGMVWGVLCQVLWLLKDERPLCWQESIVGKVQVNQPVFVGTLTGR